MTNWTTPSRWEGSSGLGRGGSGLPGPAAVTEPGSGCLLWLSSGQGLQWVLNRPLVDLGEPEALRAWRVCSVCISSIGFLPGLGLCSLCPVQPRISATASHSHKPSLGFRKLPSKSTRFFHVQLRGHVLAGVEKKVV